MAPGALIRSWAPEPLGFPAGSVEKNLAASAGDEGWISGSGRSPGEGNGNPLQYSCLENPRDRGAWQATVHGVTKSWTWLSDWAHTLGDLIGFSIRQLDWARPAHFRKTLLCLTPLPLLWQTLPPQPRSCFIPLEDNHPLLDLKTSPATYCVQVLTKTSSLVHLLILFWGDYRSQNSFTRSLEAGMWAWRHSAQPLRAQTWEPDCPFESQLCHELCDLRPVSELLCASVQGGPVVSSVKWRWYYNLCYWVIWGLNETSHFIFLEFCLGHRMYKCKNTHKMLGWGLINSILPPWAMNLEEIRQRLRNSWEVIRDSAVTVLRIRRRNPNQVILAGESGWNF